MFHYFVVLATPYSHEYVWYPAGLILKVCFEEIRKWVDKKHTQSTMI